MNVVTLAFRDRLAYRDWRACLVHLDDLVAEVIRVRLAYRVPKETVVEMHFLAYLGLKALRDLLVTRVFLAFQDEMACKDPKVPQARTEQKA